MILSDEEVWLRAYCASMSNSSPSVTQHAWQKDAEVCLDDFRKKFRSNEDVKFPPHTTIELGTTINITDGPYKGVWEAVQGGWRKI